LDKDETTKDVPWNGREIRNGTCSSAREILPKQILAKFYWAALQTAIAFEAENEAEADRVPPGRITVRPEHFQTAVDRRKEFIIYRKSIRNQDEEARAYTEGSRAPLRMKS
jgi:hypothetical protein